MTAPPDSNPAKPSNFLRQIIERDLEQGTYAQRRWAGRPADAAEHQRGEPDPARIRTRFPPEPNGYLHVGHAKSICLNFGLARDYNGVCHMRFDDTNPEKEEQEYVDGILDAVHWLGFGWDANGTSHLYQASDYFDFMYRSAEFLIEKGLAYVDEQTPEEMRQRRGDFNTAGTDSPFRSRSPEENLKRFREMRDGLHADGAMVLRAKIDMASPNINMRDPTIYRIKHAEHHNTGSKWCIYPMYTYAHPIEDALENITHSLCTLEFEDQRPFYDWLLDRLAEGGLVNKPHPRQYEFARLNLTYVVTSKRKLKQLVEEGHVSGWDDPRMPTLVGMRRRGYTPESIQLFCERIGVSKDYSWIDYGVLDQALRDDLEPKAARAMAVLDPVKLVITNYKDVMGSDDFLDACSAPVHPHDPGRGRREFRFGKEIWIERTDYEEVPPKGYNRLYPGNKVRLKYGHVVECTGAVKDAQGRVTEVHAKLVPDTKSGTPGADAIKVKGTITWVGVADGVKAEVRLYDRLFLVAQPGTGEKDFLEELNLQSLKVVTAYLEPTVARAESGHSFQFERLGYFVADRKDHCMSAPTFNLTAGMKDTWSESAGRGEEELVDLSVLVKKIRPAQSRVLSDGHDPAIVAITERVTYVDPPLRVIQKGADTSPFVIVRAPGAVGKSALAQYVAWQKKLPLWDMSKQDLGDHVFVGLLTNAFGDANFSQVTTSLASGDFGIVVDALDEAEVRSGSARLKTVLKEIAGKVKSASKHVIILFGRTDTADFAYHVLSDLDFLNATIPVYEISFFGQAKARQLVRTITDKRVADTVLNTILERIERALASVLGIDAGRRWQHPDFQSFMGYAPVLLAIGALVNQEPNPQKLVQELSEPEWLSQARGSEFLYRLIWLLLEREQGKFRTNAEAAPEIATERASTPWEKLYTPTEQLTRLAAKEFADVEGYSTEVVESLSPNLRKYYERSISDFLPQHPFIRNGLFANPIFRDFLLAWSLKSDDLSVEAEQYFMGQRISPTAALFALYSEMPGRAASEHIGYLIDSFFAAERGAESDAQAVVTQTNASQAILNMWVSKGAGLSEARQVTVSVSGRGLRFSSRVRNVTISATSQIEFGDGGRYIDLANVHVQGRNVVFNGQELSVRNGESPVVLDISDVSTTAHAIDIKAPDRTSLVLLAPRSLPHPWKQYQVGVPSATLDSATLSAIHGMQGIVRTFRKHGKAEFARYKELIDYLVVGNDPNQKALLAFMKSKGLIQQRGSMYVMTATKANEYGISWNMAQASQVNDALLRFAGEFVSLRTNKAH